MFPRAHFILYTINTNVCGTDVVLQRFTTGLCLIGIRQQTSLITCLREKGSPKGREGFIYNHVNIMTCDLCFPSMNNDYSGHICIILLFLYCSFSISDRVFYHMFNAELL